MKHSSKEKVVKLKNRYTGDIVYTNSYNEIQETNGVKFIKVFSENNPSRNFLVNREAFDKIV